MRRDGERSLFREAELAVTWSDVDAERIRDVAKAIGVTPECLIQYAVEEVLEEATFTRAIARAPNIEDIRKVEAKDVIGTCDQEERP